MSTWKACFATLQRQELGQRLDALLRVWGPLVLLVFAIFYYGQYYRSGLNLGGEGGTVAVNAMRLNEGWLPGRDTSLNYNVLWFYPVAWLFQLTGPDYIALRVYFFVLCFLTGWLGFLIVRRVTGSGCYALGIGLLMLMIPGMMFRNYMGLITVLNAWATLHTFVWDHDDTGWRRWMWFGAAGLVLGLTYLVRVDVGLFFTVIYFGLIVLYPLGVRNEFWRRLPVAAVGGVVCLLAAVTVHLPFYFDAHRRGFGPEFLGEYLGKWNYIKYETGRTLLPGSSPTPTPPSGQSLASPMAEWIPVRFKKTPKEWVQLAQAERLKRAEVERHGRPRPSLCDLFNQDSFYNAAFILILYLPILVSGILFIAAGGVLVWSILKVRASLKEPALVCLVTLGSTLTIFSQYFFFRPDTPHLSEFMVPFLVTMACACFYAARLMVAGHSWLMRVTAASFILLCVVSEGLYFYHSFPKESAGTIAAARKRSQEVLADNGVRVFVKKGQQRWLQDLHDTIVRYSTPDEWVVTFPYSPTINFMTNRRSYLKDLYVDNATAGRNFRIEKIAEFERFKPAVIVIDQRPINDTEFSRFRNWAAPTYDYIRSHYVLAGTFDTNEVYVHPDKIPPQT